MHQHSIGHMTTFQLLLVEEKHQVPFHTYLQAQTSTCVELIMLRKLSNMKESKVLIGDPNRQQ
jgi:hypothetical protein